MTDLVSIIGRGGRLSQQVSEALIMLIRHGGELGELEQREIVDPHSGERRTVKAVPSSWPRRLAKAVEVGAFAKKTPQEIVQRILSTPEAP